MHFAGDVDFSHCRFRRRALFEDTIFPGKTYFIYSQFDEDASFAGRFDEEARFDEVMFSSYVIFGCDFRSVAWFNRATFKSWVSVALRSGMRVQFDEAYLSTVVLGRFGKIADVRTRTDVDVSLAGVVLRNSLSLACWQGRMRLVSLRSAVLEAPLVIGDSVDLGGCRMSHASGLEQLRIVQADPCGAFTGAGRSWQTSSNRFVTPSPSRSRWSPTM